MKKLFTLILVTLTSMSLWSGVYVFTEKKQVITDGNWTITGPDNDASEQSSVIFPDTELEPGFPTGTQGKANYFKINGSGDLGAKLTTAKRVTIKGLSAGDQISVYWFSTNTTTSTMTLSYAHEANRGTKLKDSESITPVKKTVYKSTFSALTADEITKITSAYAGSEQLAYISCNNSVYIYAIKIEGSTSTTVEVSSVAVSPAEVTLDIDGTKQLTATVTVTPDNADNKKVTWKSSNTGVATVSETGLVTAVGTGDATITATSTKDETKKGECKVTVNAPAEEIPVESITLNKSQETISIGGSFTLAVIYNPTNANTGKAITWSSTNDAVAKVEDGLVTGISEGTATIKATTDNGKEASCSVKVEAIHVQSVTLDKTEATIKEGATVKLTATVLPANATNKKITWSSNNESVAKVVDGTVTGLAEGVATITVTTEDGNKTATCNVTILPAASVVTDLTVHAPEVYEEAEPNGWGGTLTTFSGKQYELFYFTKKDSKIAVGLDPLASKNIATQSSGNEFAVRGNWMNGSKLQVEGSTSDDSDTKATGADEFKDCKGSLKMGGGAKVSLYVKGYSKFSIIGKDNNTTPSGTNARWLQIYVDGEEVTRTADINKENATIRRYEISPEKDHLIEVISVHSSNSYLYALSLEVSDAPLVRQVSGPKTQTVYQTKEMEPTAYVVRRAASHKLAWKNGNAIDGIKLTDGTNDSVFVSGKANVATGSYTYIIQALDASGNVSATEEGTIKVETHIFDNERGNDTKVNVGEALKPLSFKYYALNSADIQLTCDITGLSLSYNRDSIATLEGTPAANTTAGAHTYTIKAVGGNTISGTITIDVPDPYFEPIADVIARAAQPLSFAIIAHHAANVTITGLPEGFTYNYSQTTDEATIKGTPTAAGETYEFTATATPRYAGKSPATATGKIIVIGDAEKTLLVVHKDLQSIEDEPIAKLLKDETNLFSYFTMRGQDELEGSSLSAFDMILISENADANNEEVQNITKQGSKPVLNMKAFTYSPDRLDWGKPNNGTVDTTGTKNALNIYVERDDHPIFKGWKNHGDKLQILDKMEQRGLMPIAINSEKLSSSYCLATSYTRSIDDYYKDGELQTFLHEIPAGARGGQKYICLPIALSSSKYLNADGKQLVKKVVEYLLDEQQSFSTTAWLQIDTFNVAGIDASIDFGSNTIELEIPVKKFQELDSLKHATPKIVLNDPVYSHVTPASGVEIDLHYATFVPAVYVVSDYIRREVYEVYVRTIGTQGIDAIYTVGEWVNIYDIFGRKVTTTNANIYTADLPRGIYIVVTEQGQTLKIMR